MKKQETDWWNKLQGGVNGYLDIVQNLLKEDADMESIIPVLADWKKGPLRLLREQNSACFHGLESIRARVIRSWRVLGKCDRSLG